MNERHELALKYYFQAAEAWAQGRKEEAKSLDTIAFAVEFNTRELSYLVSDLKDRIDAETKSDSRRIARLEESILKRRQDVDKYWNQAAAAGAVEDKEPAKEEPAHAI